MTGIPWTRSPIFSALPERHLEAIAAFVTHRALARGEYLFHEGDRCTGFFVLLEGTVLLTRFGPEAGRETPLHAVGPGQSFGEAALFAGLPFPATAVATADAKVAHIQGAPLLAMIREQPDLGLALLASQARWLQRLVTRLTVLGSQDAESRLREWLREAAGSAGVARVPGTKKALAAQLGMTPETFSRALAALRAKRLVEVRGAAIQVLGRL